MKPIITKKERSVKGYHGLKKLIPYYKKYFLLFFITLSLLVVSGLCGFLGPIFSAKALANLSQSNFKIAILLISLFLCVQIIVLIINNIYNRTYAKMSTRVMFDLKNSLMDSITRVQMYQNDQTNNGVYIERLHEDTRKCSDVLLDIMAISLEVLTNIGFLVYIAFLNIWFFVVLLAYVIILWLLDSKKEYHWYLDNKEFRHKRELSTGAYNEQIRGLKDIKSLNIRNQTILSSGLLYKSSLKSRYNALTHRYKFNLIRNVIAKICEVGFFVMGIFFIKNGWIRLDGFLVIYMYHGNIKNLASHFASIKQYAIEGEIASQRIFEIVNEYPKEEFGTKSLKKVKGSVEFKDVTFSYDDKKNILKNLSVYFPANKTTAIIGRSGSGKSTILALLNKLYPCSDGKIFIDDTEINDLNEDSLRGTIGVVTQSPYIFNCTIRENLQYIDKNATEKDMIKALKRAQIYNFIKKLDQGLDSTVGENGVMLSGGQKQRLAIARVLLKNSKIIVLDEATSALDNESQGKIVKVIENLKRDHTIIIVAHRLSTIVDSDKIIVLDDGKVIDQGTHKELFKHCKIYKHLYKSEETNEMLAKSLKEIK